MKSPSPWILLLAGLGAARPAAAQLPEWVNQVLIAADLPVSANDARTEGAPDEEVKQVLNAMVTEDMSAFEARQVIDEERAARRDHGPVDNFGAFVQAKLRQGLRGQDLAEAIRAEHAARGKGHKGKGGGPGDEGEREDHGKPPAAQPHGPPDEKGKPDRPGAKSDRPGGKPDEPGKSAARPN